MIDWTIMSKPMYMPQFTLDDYENVYADRHRLQDVVAKWAKAKPETAALLSADGSRAVSWSEFDRATTAWAGELLRMGFTKGDFLVTMLPMTVDHVLLEYGCFKIGVIVAPLDLRLSAAEVIRALEILRPRGFAGLGVKAPFDFRNCGARCRRSANGWSISLWRIRTRQYRARCLLLRLPSELAVAKRPRWPRLPQT